MPMSTLIGLAGLMGAAGVVLAAASAHAGSAIRLDSAGYMLLFHASALVSGVVALDRGLLCVPSAWLRSPASWSAPRCSPGISRFAPLREAGCSRWLRRPVESS